MARTPVKKTAVKRTRKVSTPQETAANAVSTALANVARVVLCCFPGSSTQYSYYTRDESIGKGDYCLVVSPYENRNGGSHAITELGGYLNIVKVADVKETVQAVNAAHSWILQRLDISAALNEAARREAAKVLRAKISKARKAAEERVQLEQLRSLSPELDSLLTQLDELEGVIPSA